MDPLATAQLSLNRQRSGRRSSIEVTARVPVPHAALRAAAGPLADLPMGGRAEDDQPVGRRLEGIPGFGIVRVAEAAGSDPEVLRLENYDTDIPPHPDAVEVTRVAIGRDEANSYLSFSGLDEMKEAVAELTARRGGPRYDPYGEIVITDGDGSAILNALLVLTDPGDEVILTDPTYAGMFQRVRLVGAVPRFRARRMVRAVRRRSMRARCVRALAGVARAKV